MFCLFADCPAVVITDFRWSKNLVLTQLSGVKYNEEPVYRDSYGYIYYKNTAGSNTWQMIVFQNDFAA